MWRLRKRMLAAPNIRLTNLSKVDERLEAHVDALRVAGEAGRTRACEAMEQTEPGALFACGVLAIETGDPQRLVDVLARAVDVAMQLPKDVGAEFSPDVTGALCWSQRDSATRSIVRLRSAPELLQRAVANGALGARRVDPSPGIASALVDPSPLVRARAYRTAGQLGRSDLTAQLRPGLTDPDPECRFWSACAAARMGATEPLDTLADIAWNNLPRADRALDLMLRRLDVPQANAWLREFAKLPDRQRSLIRATGVIGDPLYIPWLIEHMADLPTARLAGESFSMITGLDLAYRDLDRRPPADFQSGPNDDPADENVALDEDENLPWPDPERIGQWWTANRSRFSVGTPYFLGAPKATADWLEALSDAFQRQRHAAALELAIRQPDKAMFEVRARGRLQRQLLARARGSA